MSISKILAEFVAATKYKDIPDHVIQNQKKSIMDAVGITFGASTLGDGCKEMVKIAEALSAGGEGEATVIGFNKKLPMSWAAFANASMAHSLDFGDTHDKSTIHSNASSFPAALAVAEKMGNVSGRDLIAALVLGSETAIRIALAADVNTVEYGFYIPTIYSSYSATAAVAKLMGLSAEQIVSAFSFNLCQTMCSSELTNNKATVIRSIREAFAARNAIVACCMAKENLIGFEEPLEGKLGFYHTFLRGSYTAGRVTDGLGKKWESAELTYKVWPCCFGVHSPITGVLGLMKKHRIKADDIHHIEISIGAQNHMLFEPLQERRNPETAIVGKFSIPFSVAVAVLNSTVTIDSYSDECLRDEKTRALAAKIDYIYRNDWQRGKETYANIVIDTSKGVFETFISSPMGTPENPMDDDAFEAKFDSCVSKAFYAVEQGRIGKIKSIIREMEILPDIGSFTSLL